MIDGSIAGRWVSVRAMVGSSGLWRANGTIIVPASLPLDAPLVARLTAWMAWYDRCIEQPLTVFDYPAFSREGEQIAAEIKARLPDWTVSYFNLALAISLILESDLSAGLKLQEMYDYEITLQG